jgi:diguanylate cyclase (GGDEF)-like protein
MENRKFRLRLADFFGPVRKFIIIIGLVISAAIISIYIGIYINYRNMTLNTVQDEASSYFDLIVKAREWNALHSGVYVIKKPGVESSKYFKKLGINPEIKTADGKVLTLQNPALMTKEISKLTDNKEGISFHLTSLRLVNPDNAPDRFEKSALVDFELGQQEAWEIAGDGSAARFRLMKPLIIQKGCLNCHKDYSLGDVRGGICINVPYGVVEKSLRSTRNKIAALSVLTIVLIMGTLYVSSSRMLAQLSEMQKKLLEASITDDLTGIHNRRYVMERLSEECTKTRRTGKPLSVIIFDIDNFKLVNDTYGHPFGDRVLKGVSERVKSSLRAYDILARFGGEEFVILAPDTPLEDAVNLARRLNSLIKANTIGDGNNSTTITASFGASVTTGTEGSCDTLLARADKALYRAKDLGRDRVEF